jgi:hypothetical protein
MELGRAINGCGSELGAVATRLIKRNLAGGGQQVALLADLLDDRPQVRVGRVTPAKELGPAPPLYEPI